jgi:hypothetical protein
MCLKSFNTQLRRSVYAMVGLSCVAVPTFAAPLRDVPANHWARAAVVSVTAKKLMDAPGGAFQGDKPVTRYELAVTLDRLVNYIEEGRKPLHPTAPPQPVRVPSKASATVRAALTHLTADNFIPSDSILLQGTGREVVTADQLTTILSQVTIRISDRALGPPPQ